MYLIVCKRLEDGSNCMGVTSWDADTESLKVLGGSSTTSHSLTQGDFESVSSIAGGCSALCRGSCDAQIINCVSA